jgi:LysM repeat protein
MKKPKFLAKLAAILPPRPKKKYQVTARAARAQPIEEYDDGQPTTKLSSAFVVVLILHVVAVGGIYAFNSIKASRRNHAQILAATNPPPVANAKPAGDRGSVPAASPAPAVKPSASHPADPAAAPAPGENGAAAKTAGLRQYQVKAGDNPTKIAFAYRVTVPELLAANGLKDNATLHVGQTLSIPASKADPKAQPDAHKAETTPKLTDIPPTKTTPGLYLVKKGDTIHSIAKAYGMTSDELIKLNKVPDPKKLQLGQVLKLPPRKS